MYLQMMYRKWKFVQRTLKYNNNETYNPASSDTSVLTHEHKETSSITLERSTEVHNASGPSLKHSLQIGVCLFMSQR